MFKKFDISVIDLLGFGTFVAIAFVTFVGICTIIYAIVCVFTRKSYIYMINDEGYVGYNCHADGDVKLCVNANTGKLQVVDYYYTYGGEHN